MFLRTTCASVLLLACSIPAHAQPSEAAALQFQRNLLQVLECSAGADVQQDVVSRLRAARYADAADRPADLRDWRFEQKEEDDDRRVTVITPPQSMVAHGVQAAHFFADALGFSIAVDTAQRERIVAAHGLRLQSSTLREPFEVWSAPTTPIIVRSAGDGYRLGCTPVAKGNGAPARQAPAVAVKDLQNAIECRANQATMARLQVFWRGVSERPQFAWPQDVRSVNEVNYTVGDAELPLLLIGLQAPMQVHGVSTHTIAVTFGGFLGADLGDVAVAPVLAHTGMGAAHQVGKDTWQRVLPSVAFSAGKWIPQHIVMRTDEGRVIAGCASDYVRSTAD